MKFSATSEKLRHELCHKLRQAVSQNDNYHNKVFELNNGRILQDISYTNLQTKVISLAQSIESLGKIKQDESSFEQMYIRKAGLVQDLHNEIVSRRDENRLLLNQREKYRTELLHMAEVKITDDKRFEYLKA